MQRILMTMVEVGNGHKAPALAVKKALESLFPGRFFIHVSDFARESGAVSTDIALKKAWDSSARHYRAFRFLYSLIDVFPALGRGYMRAAYKDFFKKGAEFIRDFSPDIVFSTYTISSSVAAYARRVHGLDYKIVVFVADPFDAYSWWAEKDADLFIVSSAMAKERLIRQKIDEKKIFVMPYPVMPDFEDARGDRTLICEEFSFLPENPVVLATGGGMGLGKVSLYAERLVKSAVPVNILFLAGKNRELYRRMKAVEDLCKGPSRLRVLDYTDRVAELVSACDAVMGKAGASTAMEAAVCAKPFLFTDWIAQNDFAIIRFFTSNGYGWFFKRPYELVEFFSQDVSSVLEKASLRLRGAGFRSGVEDIALFLADLL